LGACPIHSRQQGIHISHPQGRVHVRGSRGDGRSLNPAPAGLHWRPDPRGHILMMIRLGVVVGVPPNNTAGLSLVTGVGAPKNAQSTFKARFVQVQVGPAVYLVQLVPQAGEDVSPVNGSLVAILESAGIRLAVAVQDNVPPSVTLNQGEKEWYASDGSGNKLARIKAKGNGKLYI